MAYKKITPSKKQVVRGKWNGPVPSTETNIFNTNFLIAFFHTYAGEKIFTVVKATY
jgi:hypothetical protein